MDMFVDARLEKIVKKSPSSDKKKRGETLARPVSLVSFCCGFIV
jgi:hypothetical protein